MMKIFHVTLRSSFSRLSLRFLSNFATTICIGTWCVQQSFGQITSVVPPLPVHTPEARDLGSVVFSPVSLYSGQPNISIPVYTVMNKDLSVPITLSYDAGGFVPNKASSPVGLNWSVSPGLITRTVSVFPDEMTEHLGNTSSGQGTVSKGFFNRTAMHTNEQVRTLSGLVTNNFYNKNYELAPDLFNFNFCGQSGSFMMGQDGLWYFQGEGVYKVEMANLGFPLQGFPFNNNYFGKITITDASGKKYEFGGSIASVDFTSSVATNPSHGIPTAWYLTKITAPEGHSIELEYKPLSVTNSDFTVVASTSTSDVLVKNVYLSAIKSKNNLGIVLETVTFTHSLRPVDQSFSTSYRNEQLDKIEVKDQGSTVIKEFTLGYTYHNFDTKRARALLTSLTETGKPSYSLAYYNTANLASVGPGSSLVDYWGYYNNLSKSGGSYTYNGDLEMNETPAAYNPVEAYCLSGVLRSITDPLKGVTEYTYELHQYGIYEKLIGGTASYPYFGPEVLEGTAGGLRIAKIELKQGSQVLRRRQYKYVQNYEPNTNGLKSSGILYKKPLLFNPAGLVNLPDLNSVNEPHMTYSEVAELMEDGGYKIYKFNSINEYPDRSYDDSTVPKPYLLIGSSLGGFTEYVVVNFFNNRSSVSLARGKPWDVTEYRSWGSKVNSTSYTYNFQQDGNKYAKKIVSLIFPQYGDPTHNIGVSISQLITTYESYFFPTRIAKKSEQTFGN